MRGLVGAMAQDFARNLEATAYSRAPPATSLWTMLLRLIRGWFRRAP